MFRVFRFPLAAGALALAIASGVSGLIQNAPQGPGDDGRPVAKKKRGPQLSGPAEYVEWRNQSLRDENGVIAENGLMQAKAHVDMMREMTEPIPAAGISRGSWSSIGPGNVGGRVRTIAIHPTSTDTIFIGSVAGGIWKSVNAGTTWTVVDDFMANLAVSAVLFVPGDPAIMFAGTGEGFYNGDGLRGAGIFRSANGGTTWAQLASTSTSPAAGQSATDFLYINELAISPNGTTLLAATRTGIFRSTDSGTTFTRATMVGGGPLVIGNGSFDGVMDVEFSLSDNTRAVAATNDGTALYSTDGGATWTSATGMPAIDFVRSELAVAPTNGSIVYAGVDLDGGSLFKSTDGGQTYTEIFNGATDFTVDPYCFAPGCGGSTDNSQGWYDNLLFVSPTDENFLIWGGVDLWRSVNGGLAWTRMSSWQSHSLSGATSAHADHHLAVAHPNFNGTTNQIVFFGTDGGVFRTTTVSTAGPTTNGWAELNNGLAITQFYGGAGNAASGRITGGTQDNYTLFYNPAAGTPAENWTAVFGGDGGFSAYDSADPNYFYGEYVYLTIHRNSTGGLSPSQYIYPGIGDANTTNAEFIAAFIKDPNNNNRLLAPSIRIYRTNNAKAPTPTWEVIKNSLGISDRVSAIAVAPGNSNIIYAGHAQGRLYRTTVGDGVAATVAASWTTIDDNAASNPLPNRRITRISIDPGNSEVVYVTFGGFSGDNIYKSVNGGGSWTDITGPSGGPTALPDVPVRDLEIHPANSSWIYAGTEIGIFASENGGATWSLPHDGPSNVSVDELFFLGTTLVSVTHGRGMFSTPTSGAGAVPSATNDAYSTALNTTLPVAAPGVLANDNSNGGGAMTAQLVTNVANGVLALSADGGFTYTPNGGFSGTDTFTYRAVNSVGNSNIATVTMTVTTGGGGVQPPSGLYVSSLVGNILTIRWTPPASGPTPTGFELAGGVNPGEVLAAIPTGGTAPFLTFAAPTGAFYIRIHTLAGAQKSAPSNEVRVFINVPAAPSSPVNLLGNVNGAGLALAWRNTYEGGVPTSLLLDVGGSQSATIPLTVTDSFEFGAVPAGTYTFSLRASNAAGTSGPSNPVTLTFPSACTGVPLAPSNFVATKNGNVLTLFWDPATSGPAPTFFVLNVSGAFVGSLPTTLRTLSASVGAGSYTFSVYAANSCGNGPSTASQTVTIP